MSQNAYHSNKGRLWAGTAMESRRGGFGMTPSLVLPSDYGVEINVQNILTSRFAMHPTFLLPHNKRRHLRHI